jgi:hypothetical protein
MRPRRVMGIFASSSVVDAEWPHGFGIARRTVIVGPI